MGFRLFSGIHSTYNVIQFCAHLLLGGSSSNYKKDWYNIDDIKLIGNTVTTENVLTFTESKTRKIVIFNSLMFRRNEVVHVLVSTPFVQVGKAYLLINMVFI